MTNTNFFLTSQQAAKILNISLSTLKKFIYTGKIKTITTPGGHHRIRRKDLLSISDFGSMPPKKASIPADKTTLEILDSFINALEKRQRFCQQHSRVVGKISVDIAAALQFSAARIQKIYLAALFHDIGLIGINARILNKQGPLNDAEYTIIKTHSLLGEETVSSISQISELARVVRQHHERFDGRGYPDSLKNGQIIPEAEIIAVADAFANMTAPDSYKKTLSTADALKEIERNSGSQFNPRIADTFINITKKPKKI